MLTRVFATIFLSLTFIVSLQAQDRGRRASASEHGLTGAVREVVFRCSNITDINRRLDYSYTYVYARDGKVKKSPKFDLPDCILYAGEPRWEVIKRNDKGHVEEAAFYIDDELYRREKYEYEYDSVGNWIKQVTYTISFEAISRGAEEEWKATHVCRRTIEYYR